MSVDEIKSTLSKLGIHPSKALGQNFLIDERTVDFIVNAAEIKARGGGSERENENVLEIGPGLGVLTEALARAGANVYAVEKDKILARYLTDKFHNWRNVKIVPQDALFFDPAVAFGARGTDPTTSYKLVANLPYNITSPILRKFLENAPRPSLIVVMVQKEIGERIVAPPGDPERGVLSVMVQFYGKPEIVGHVSRSKFWPQPDVDSVILRINVVNSQQSIVNSKAFFTVVRAGFSKKRAQIHNSLKNSLQIPAPDVSLLLDESKIDPTKRPEELSVEEWAALARTLEGLGRVGREKKG